MVLDALTITPIKVQLHAAIIIKITPLSVTLPVAAETNTANAHMASIAPINLRTEALSLNTHTPTAMPINTLVESKTDESPEDKPAVIDHEAIPQIPTPNTKP